MKKVCLLLGCLIAFTIHADAQIYVDSQGNVYDQRQNQKVEVTKSKQKSYTSNSKFDKSRLEFGGNLGLQFGDYTVVNVSPQVGYRFSNMFSAGLGVGYTYYSHEFRGRYDYKEHFASFNLYGTFYPVNFIVLSVKPEISRMWQTTSYYDGEKDSYSKFVPSVVIGGGIRFGPMTAQIMYDLVQDEYSPYGDNIFYSIGYTFGF